VRTTTEAETTFDRTREALAIFDAFEAGLDARFAACRTTREVCAVDAESRAEWRKVLEAFAADTAGLNDPETVRGLTSYRGAAFVRRCALVAS
jgi:hypothetical protein